MYNWLFGILLNLIMKVQMLPHIWTIMQLIFAIFSINKISYHAYKAKVSITILFYIVIHITFEGTCT